MHNGGSSLLSSGGWNNNNNNNLGRRHHQQQPMQQQQQNFGNGTINNGGPSTMMLNPYSKCWTRSNQSCFLSIWLNQTVPKGKRKHKPRGRLTQCGRTPVPSAAHGSFEVDSVERKKGVSKRLKISFESTYRWIPSNMVFWFPSNVCWSISWKTCVGATAATCVTHFVTKEKGKIWWSSSNADESSVSLSGLGSTALPSL